MALPSVPLSILDLAAVGREETVAESFAGASAERSREYLRSSDDVERLVGDSPAA